MSSGQSKKTARRSAASRGIRAGRLTLGLALLLAAVVVPDRGLEATNHETNDYVCFPTCTENDGRFLVVAGDDPTTLGGVTVDIRLSAALESASLEFDIFDGDRLSPVPTLSQPENAAATWDVFREIGTPVVRYAAPALTLQLYADKDGMGPDAPNTTAVLLQTWGDVNQASLAAGVTPLQFANNGWTGLSVVNDEEGPAKASDRFSYLLRISATDPATDKGWNAFKVRTTGSLALAPKAFAFLAPVNLPRMGFPGTVNDLRIIYPNFPQTSPTRYDGMWQFAFSLTDIADKLVVYDGDMDYGSNDCGTVDSDDPDSSSYPPFAHPNAAPEGVAKGLSGGSACAGGLSSSNPNEDHVNNTFLRRPATHLAVPGAGGILYEVMDPTGRGVVNLNPSGNTEWEQFKILREEGATPACRQVDGSGRSDADCVTPGVELIPASPGGLDPATGLVMNPQPAVWGLRRGVYQINLDGVDLNNLNFWRFEYPALGVSTSGKPVEEGAFYSVGRLVWRDYNSNGVRDNYTDPSGNVVLEPGINGVLVRVVDEFGFEQSGRTGPRTVVVNGVPQVVQGEFIFRKPKGKYTIIVDGSNFAGPSTSPTGAPIPAGALHGLTSTTVGRDNAHNIEAGLLVGPAPSYPRTYDEAVFGYTDKPRNTPPTTTADTAQSSCGATIPIYVLANDNDEDKSTLTVALHSAPTYGTAGVNADGSVTYTPTTTVSAVDTFEYKITDSAGESAIGTVKVTVVIDKAPVAVNDAAQTIAGKAIPIPVLANDSDPDDAALTIGSVTGTTTGTSVVTQFGGTVAISGGTITYTPAPGFEGNDSFSYTLTDSCATSTATVTVSVLPPPVCYAGTSATGGSVAAEQTWIYNADGTVTLRTNLSKTFLDNTYGTGQVNWPGRNHKFSHLVTSDMVQLALFDRGGAKKLEFRLDYFSASSDAAASGGYQSLGTWGGDGGMVSGDGSMIVSADSSLAANFRQGPSYWLTENSPPTDSTFTPPASHKNWIYDAWYDVTVKASAFGANGFGYPRITAIHASPSKTGTETEPLKVVDCAGRVVTYPAGPSGTPNGVGGKAKGK